MGSTHSSSRDSYQSDSENDPWELTDVKLLPYMSTFLKENQENGKRSKNSRRTKFNDYQSVTLGDEYVDRVASTLADKSNLPVYQKEILSGRYLQHLNPADSEPTAFKTGCLLPEFPELRDSYDQFCTTLSANSSNEDLQVKRSLKYLDDTETSLPTYPPHELPDDAHLACKRRKKTILEEASDAHEKYQRWSMPEFTKLWYETLDSDTETGIMVPTTNRETQYNDAGSFVSSNHLVYTDPEEQISAPQKLETSKDKMGKNCKVTKKECLSCPNIVCTESQESLYYASSDLNESNQHCLLTSTPEGTNPGFIKITTENNHYPSWRETEFSCVPYVNGSSDGHESTLGSSSSNCEASVCASDSGYSGMSSGVSSGTRDSSEGDEQYNGDLYVEKETLSKSELYKTLKDLQENIGQLDDNDNNEKDKSYNIHIDRPLVCGHTSSYPDVIAEKRISEVRKNRHCAQLLKEFRVIKNLHSGDTFSSNYSLYRTYDV